VPKGCKIECGAVPELEREHVEDRVATVGAYLRDPVHKSGSGMLMAVGRKLLEGFVREVEGGKGSLSGNAG